MKKTITWAAVCLVAALTLGGCSKGNTTNQGGVSASPTSSPAASPSAPADSSASVQPSGSSAPSETASASPTESAAAGEKAVAPEKSPVGDIPDSQQFVKYSSKDGGYSVEVPEGWARTEQGSDASFISKLDGVKVSLTTADQPLTADSVKTAQAADLVKTGRAVKIGKIKEVNLPNGKAIRVSYTSNSEPNSVTGKQVRLDNETYYYYKDKKMVVLTLWAPLGADNVDQWKRMSESFGWDAK